jgi:ParB-like chromosome segregation protein Spo0J
MTDREVHPVAALFPMLAEDELADMAADIVQRGLLHPIVLDADGRILDGRNRYAACELAGVEPRFETYDGADPAGYALAANIQRRSLTKGQQAAVIAKSGVEYHGDTDRPSKQLVSKARVIRDHVPDLLDSVISGTTGIREAYEEARRIKTAADSEVAQLERLRAEDPELAEKVVQGDLSLPGARAELAERQRKHAEEQRDARALLTRIVDLTAPPSMSEDFLDAWARQLGDLDPDLISRTEQAGDVLFSLVKRIRQ